MKKKSKMNKENLTPLLDKEFIKYVCQDIVKQEMAIEQKSLVKFIKSEARNEFLKKVKMGSGRLHNLTLLLIAIKCLTTDTKLYQKYESYY